MSSQSQLPTVDERLQTLRDTHGESVSVDELGDVVYGVLETLEGDLMVGRDSANGSIHQELTDLSTYMEQTRRELATIRPHYTRLEEIPKATDELDAVVQATEEATDRILDAAEEMEAIAKTADAVTAERVLAVVTKIYEASNFQDITGQRITKVLNTLRYAEEKIGMMAELLGHAEDAVEFVDDDPVDEEADLLEGPQMADAANSQDDIDALFADLD